MMRKLLLTALLVSAPVTVSASGFGHVHLSHLEPTKNEAMWLRAVQATPMYPRQLAQRGVVGCGVFKVTVDENGKTDSVDLVSSVPARGIERPVASVIRSWEWENVSGAASQAEEKLIRLDFCMGGGSQEEVEQLCVAQSQYSCSQ